MSSPDQRFVCHIGAHVTGAPQVQRYLREHTDDLERQGLHHLPRGLMSKLVGMGPKLVAEPDRLGREVRAALRRPGIDGLLVSHENLIGRPFTDAGGGLYPDARPTLEALRKMVEPYDCTLVLSVRPQADFLESYYLRMVNAGEWDTFDTWVGKLNLDDISWLPLHEHLVEVFGADVRVLDYAKVESDAVAQVREFFRLIRADLPPDLHVAPVRNLRHSQKGLRMALAANPYLRDPDERASLRAFLHRSFSDRDYPRAALLTGEQRAALDDRYGAEYQRLVAETAPKARP